MIFLKSEKLFKTIFVKGYYFTDFITTFEKPCREHIHYRISKHQMKNTTW